MKIGDLPSIGVQVVRVDDDAGSKLNLHVGEALGGEAVGTAVGRYVVSNRVSGKIRWG